MGFPVARIPALQRLSRLAGSRSALGATSAFLIVSRVGGALASLGATVLMARLMDPADVGFVLTLIASAFLASVLSTLNVESGSIRFLVAAREARRPAEARGFIFSGRAVLLCAAPVAIAAFVVANAPHPRTLPADYLRAIGFAAATIPLMGWLRLNGAHGTALGEVRRSSGPRSGLQPLLFLAILALAAIGYDDTGPDAVLAAFFAAAAITAATQAFLLRSAFRAFAGAGRAQKRWSDWALNGLFLTPILLMQEYMQYAVTIAASLGLNPTDTAYLGVALRFIALIRFAVMAVNMAASPKISSAMARRDVAERDRQLHAAAMVKSGPVLLAVIAIWVFSADLLALFGDAYRGANEALLWFTLIPLASAIFGPNPLLLNVAGERRAIFALSSLAFAALFVATPLAGAAHGVAGAAATASLIYVAWEIALYIAARRLTRADASLAAAISSAIDRRRLALAGG